MKVENKNNFARIKSIFLSMKYLFKVLFQRHSLTVIKVALSAIIFTSCCGFCFNAEPPKSTGIIDGNLQPCPNSPNCVSTEATDKKHAIEPLHYKSNKPLDNIESFLEEHYITNVIKKTSLYLHVVVTTKTFKFKDDLEFLVDLEKGIIKVRSASRLGYSDMGVNRARIENIRKNCAL